MGNFSLTNLSIEIRFVDNKIQYFIRKIVKFLMIALIFLKKYGSKLFTISGNISPV